MQQPESHILVIFGASGDLTKRKLIPALFELDQQKLLPEKFAILGVSRTEMTDQAFREKMREFLPFTSPNDAAFSKFLEAIYYQSLETSEASDYPKLKERLERLGDRLSIPANYIFYLSTPPQLYRVIPQILAESGMNDLSTGFKRIIIEKPFGTDLDSARELNKNLLTFYSEGAFQN